MASNGARVICVASLRAEAVRPFMLQPHACAARAGELTGAHAKQTALPLELAARPAAHGAHPVEPWPGA